MCTSFPSTFRLYAEPCGDFEHAGHKSDGSTVCSGAPRLQRKGKSDQPDVHWTRLRRSRHACPGQSLPGRDRLAFTASETVKSLAGSQEKVNQRSSHLRNQRSGHQRVLVIEAESALLSIQ